MEFKKYQKVRRIGEKDTKGINAGTCYVFPKIDGTNASVWLGDDGELKAGSRNRTLSLENDNQGFYEWVLQQDNIKEFLEHYPKLRLFGEWLVPHSLKTYRDDAWRDFYVFDVMNHKTNGDPIYVPYEGYKPLMEMYDIEYIAPLGIVKDGNTENFMHYLDKNNYLIEDGEGVGEGVVVKNYEYVNPYGKTQFGKIVTSKFKEKLHKNMGAPEKEFKSVEREIANEYVTEGRVEKVFQKIKNDHDGWRSKFIPELLGRVYHDMVTEEVWNFVQQHNNPMIDFGTLKHMVINNIKQHKPELF